MCLASVGAFGCVVFTVLSEKTFKWQETKARKAWELRTLEKTAVGLGSTGVSLSIKSIISVPPRLILSIDWLITVNRSHHFTATAPLFPRNQRKRNPHQRWATRAQSFCFKICFWIVAIKNVSGIKLIRDEEALACVSLTHKTLQHRHADENYGKTRNCERDTGKETWVQECTPVEFGLN